MIKIPSSSSPNALVATESDSDYFATETHYLSLVNRIDASLRTDGSFVLVTGDPPPASDLLIRALRESTHSHSAVIGIVCCVELTSEDLSRALSVAATLPASGARIAKPQTPEPSQPLFVFTDADQLSDRQIKEIFEDPQYSGGKGTAVLLLAPSGFLNRLEEPSLHFLKKRLAAHFGFQEIGHDEGIEFLRHQLAARHAHGESRGIPAGVFRGLAASGVLLVIGIGACLFLQHYHLLSEPFERSAPAVIPKSKVVTPRSTSDTRARPRPEAETVPAAPGMPAIAAAPQPAPVQPKEAPSHAAPTPAEDHATPRAPLPAEPYPGEPALTPEKTAPSSAPPSTAGTPGPHVPPVGAGSTITQSARLGEPTPPVASPELLPQPVSPKAGSSTASHPPTQSSPSQGPPSTEIAALVSRGDSFLSVGDIVSARLFYERAADAGSGSAALRLGATFDPGFLGRAGIRGITGDAAHAASWYHRARELGDPAAADRLKDLGQQRTSELNSSPR
jgi:hypothetical protein